MIVLLKRNSISRDEPLCTNTDIIKSNNYYRYEILNIYENSKFEYIVK